MDCLGQANFGTGSDQNGQQDEERIKAAVSAAENYGNFYGQNLSAVQAGVLLVYGVLTVLGLDVSVWRLVLFAVPITTVSVLLGIAQFALFDRQMGRRGTKQ